MFSEFFTTSKWTYIYFIGGFEVDFSSNVDDVEAGLDIVARGILKHGVTSFCPTIVTSPLSVYHEV